MKSSLDECDVYEEESEVNSSHYVILRLLPKMIKNKSKYNMQKLISAEIRYFSKNKTNNENIQMIDKLSSTFNFQIPIFNRYFYFETIYTKIEDNILYFRFDIKLDDYIDYEDNNEKMKELILREDY